MKPKRIFIAGHRGLVGGALVRHYQKLPDWEILTRGREELDLRDPLAVQAFFEKERPEYVILAAAKVGGIGANAAMPVVFLLENLKIQNAVIEACHTCGVKKLLFLGSTCIYPKTAPMPLREDSLLTGPMETTNMPYSVAKIAGITLCQAYRRQFGADFITAMPANLYGPGDNFHPDHSHVLPSLMRKFHEAATQDRAEVTLWGTGSPSREFMHCDDLADACAFLLENYNGEEIVNVGCGEEIRIREAAEVLQEVTGFRGKIVWDTSKPDGNPRRLLDVTRLSNMGWHSKIPFRDGVASTYAWYRSHIAEARED
ncbi:MAG: GDP-L-fucose synthase [Verrucomicrobiaceae bacterium]|nr:GDP-L-fucose synthase [Verrucomicrobiaceae bacterium]